MVPPVHYEKVIPGIQPNYDSFYDLFYQTYRFLQPIVNRELREMTYYLFYLTTRRVKIIIYYHTI